MKKSKRTIIYLFLFLGLYLSLTLIFKTYPLSEMNIVAGCIAIIIAIIATFFSIRIIWKLEDSQKPNVIIFLDSDSQSNEMKLVIKNTGGCSAYDIKLNWIDPLTGIKGNEIKFPQVPVLHKGDCVNLIVDLFTERFKKEDNNQIFKGEVQFKYSKTNKKYTKKLFELDLDQFKINERPITDDQKFQLKNSLSKDKIREKNSPLKVLV